MAAAVRQEQSRFPITLWPGVPLGKVLVERWAPLLGDGGAVLWRGPDEPRELPEEWVLRTLADADLSSDMVVVDILKEYGVISWPYFDRALLPRDAWDRLVPAPEADTTPGQWWSDRSDGTIEDIRWWLRTARALAFTWSNRLLGLPLAKAWTDEGFLGVTTEEDVWTQLALSFDAGLRPFRARVEYRRDFHGGYQHAFGVSRVGLYSAACSQVFDLIVTEETARKCENKSCGRIFVHQLGGAAYGQYRSKGLRFCSPSCARAETQRQYRRRQKGKANA